MFRTNGLWLLTSKRLSIVLLPFSSFSYSAQIRLHIRSRVCNISICWYSQIRTAVSRDRHYLLWILIDDQQRALVLETLNLSSWTRFDQSPFLVVLFFFFCFILSLSLFYPSSVWNVLFLTIALPDLHHTEKSLQAFHRFISIFFILSRYFSSESCAYNNYSNRSDTTLQNDQCLEMKCNVTNKFLKNNLLPTRPLIVTGLIINFFWTWIWRGLLLKRSVVLLEPNEVYSQKLEKIYDQGLVNLYRDNQQQVKQKTSSKK